MGWNTPVIPRSPVTDAYLREGYVEIVLENGTTFRGVPEGDRCAYTEIIEVVGLDSLVGHVLTSFETKDYVSERDPEPWGDTLDNFVEVVHAEGDIDAAILCTCSHNGYYSGWIGWSVR